MNCFRITLACRTRSFLWQYGSMAVCRIPPRPRLDNGMAMTIAVVRCSPPHHPLLLSVRRMHISVICATFLPSLDLVKWA